MVETFVSQSVSYGLLIYMESVVFACLLFVRCYPFFSPWSGADLLFGTYVIDFAKVFHGSCLFMLQFAAMPFQLLCLCGSHYFLMVKGCLALKCKKVQLQSPIACVATGLNSIVHRLRFVRFIGLACIVIKIMFLIRVACLEMNLFTLISQLHLFAIA